MLQPPQDQGAEQVMGGEQSLRDWTGMAAYRTKWLKTARLPGGG